MKNTWKRTIAILLSMLLILTALPMALATPASCGASVTYELDSSGSMKITGTGAMTSFTSAADVPWKADLASIKQVIVTNGVTSIGAYAFSGCTSLLDVSLPTGLAKIEKSAFEGCTGLRSITIPNTTTEIGEKAFNNCSALKTISITGTTTNILGSGTTISNTATIYGYPESTAETWAKTYARPFVSLGSGTQQVENNPAAVSGTTTGNSLQQILAKLTTYIQPLLTMFKNLFSQLLANIGSGNASGNTSTTGTTGAGGVTNSSTASAAGNVSNILGSIMNSFMSFVNSTLSNMNAGSTATTGTGTGTGTGPTAGTGTTTAAGTGFDLSTILGLFGNLMNSASATTTTAAAK